MGLSLTDQKIIESMIGSTFGRLTVIKRAPNYKAGATRWVCKCSCGKEIITYGSNLRTGKTKSCGCLAIDTRKKTPYKHGMANSRLYNIWHGIKNRCELESSTGYRLYGARGIHICEEWKSEFTNFYDWAISHGYTESLELDRIDNDKGYSPDNCRWVTHKENCNNRRNSKNRLTGRMMSDSNGKARKRPREVRTPVGQMKNNTVDSIAQEQEGMQA